MKKLLLVLLMTLGLLASSCKSSNNSKSTATYRQGQSYAKVEPITIGGEPVITLNRPRTEDQSRPQFLEATVLPGRGMNLLQVRAYLPSKGDIALLHAPSLSEAKEFLDTQNDPFGTNGFRIGAAILLPWANRIRGKLSPDGKSIETSIGGKTLLLPADWAGKNPGAEKHAIHGLILAAKFQDVTQQNGLTESSVSGVLHAGNFGGHWPSQTDVNTHIVLKDDALDIDVTAQCRSGGPADGRSVPSLLQITQRQSQPSEAAASESNTSARKQLRRCVSNRQTRPNWRRSGLPRFVPVFDTTESDWTRLAS